MSSKKCEGTELGLDPWGKDHVLFTSVLSAAQGQAQSKWEATFEDLWRQLLWNWNMSEQSRA